MHTPDAADLQAFLALVNSPLRSPAREAALMQWQQYKLARQLQWLDPEVARTKAGHLRALLAPAIDLRGADLTDVCIGCADLRGVRLDGARFRLDQRSWTGLKAIQAEQASLRGAELQQARLMWADLRGADLAGAQLREADLRGANLACANLAGAQLQGANLMHANLVCADLRGADLAGCRVYGASVWDAQLDSDDAARALQRDLVVTPEVQPPVTVDRLEVAQFVYLLLSNPRIRDVIDTVCDRAVLILGRFSEGRLALLQALRGALRERGFVPMVFDFERSRSQDLTETVRTLASLSRFVVADLSSPRSNPLELQATVPDIMVPLVPLLAEGEQPFAMFTDLRNKYDWVLDPLVYADAQELLAVLDDAVIAPALALHAELLARRAQALRVRRAADFRKPTN